MRLSTKMKISFCVLILVPVFLSLVSFVGLMALKLGQIKNSYNTSVSSYEILANPVELVSELCRNEYNKLLAASQDNPSALSDRQFLDGINKELEKRNAFLIVVDSNGFKYTGSDEAERVLRALGKIDFQDQTGTGIYLGEGFQMVINRIDYTDADMDGTAFVVMKVSEIIPQIKRLILDTVIAIVLVLIMTSGLFTAWMYKGMVNPINKLKLATQNIKNGNLDFDMDVSGKDEIGELCRDFDAMRIRLKEDAEEKVAMDAENRELISNISHDLKTPITAIKGYVEGILDGVVDSREKLDRYLRTIYNKACDMDRLIDELTFYSKIDSNRIPYNFIAIGVADYFTDCVEEVRDELEAQGIAVTSAIDVSDDVKVMIDPEQIKRVVNNIVGNSAKYMDRQDGVVDIRVGCDEHNIYVDIGDNGPGLGEDDLTHIFDRFYRSDTSRNSKKGGSGIGLSIVKKIIADHGGDVSAESEPGKGLTMHIRFDRYYKEPENKEEEV